MHDKIDPLLEEAKKVSVPLPVQVDASVYCRDDRLIDALINNDDVPDQRARSGVHRFLLKENILCDKLRIRQSEFFAYKRFKFVWRDSSGHQHSKILEADSEVLEVAVGRLISEFSLEIPTKNWASSRGKVISIEAIGYSLKHLESFADELAKVHDIETRVNTMLEAASIELVDADAQRAEVLAKVADLENESTDKWTAIAELKAEIDDLNKAQVEAKSLLHQASADHTVMEQKKSVIEHDLQDFQVQRKSIVEELDEKNKDLRLLKNQINSFPSEISAFRKEGANNSRTYVILAAIPLLILGFVTYILFDRALGFSNDLSEMDATEGLLKVMGRIPFVAISATVIAACYALARVFIAEIIAINKQGLNLSKISIIAKDVADSSGFGLELDENEVFERRTLIRMELLRAHLTEYLGKNYSFELKWPWQHAKELHSGQDKLLENTSSSPLDDKQSDEEV